MAPSLLYDTVLIPRVCTVYSKNKRSSTVSGKNGIVGTGHYIIIINLFTPPHAPRRCRHGYRFVRRRYNGRRCRCGAADRISRERGNAAGPTDRQSDPRRRRQRLKPVEFFRYAGPSSLRFSEPVGGPRTSTPGRLTKPEFVDTDEPQVRRRQVSTKYKPRENSMRIFGPCSGDTAETERTGAHSFGSTFVRVLPTRRAGRSAAFQKRVHGPRVSARRIALVRATLAVSVGDDS